MFKLQKSSSTEQILRQIKKQRISISPAIHGAGSAPTSPELPTTATERPTSKTRMSTASRATADSPRAKDQIQYQAISPEITEDHTIETLYRAVHARIIQKEELPHRTLSTIPAKSRFVPVVLNSIGNYDLTQDYYSPPVGRCEFNGVPFLISRGTGCYSSRYVAYQNIDFRRPISACAFCVFSGSIRRIL